MTSSTYTCLVLLAGSSAVAGALFYRATYLVRNFLKKRRLARARALLEPINASPRCPELKKIHAWDSLLMNIVESETIEERESLYCKECGTIQGSDMAFTQHGLFVINNQKQVEVLAKARAQQLAEYREKRLQEMFQELKEDDPDMSLEDAFLAGSEAIFQIEDEITVKAMEAEKKRILEFVKTGNIPE